MRKHLSTIILVIVLILGVMILLYPTVSDYWNSFHQSRAIASYLEEIENIHTKTSIPVVNAETAPGSAAPTKSLGATVYDDGGIPSETDPEAKDTSKDKSAKSAKGKTGKRGRKSSKDKE